MLVKNNVVFLSKYSKMKSNEVQNKKTIILTELHNNQLTSLNEFSLRGVSIAELSFKAKLEQPAYVVEKALINRKNILDSISNIFQKDRELLSTSFYGDVSDETKFSKPGWYLSLKNKQGSESENISKINPRKFVSLYNCLYNNELSSVYEVSKDNKKYLDVQKNIDIKNLGIDSQKLDKYIERRIDDYFNNVGNNEKIISGTYSKDFVSSTKNQFVSKLHSNPLFIKPEILLEFFNIVDDVLNDVDNETYNNIYLNLFNLSEALEIKDKQLMITSFDALQKDVLPVWENEILTSQAIDIEKKQRIVSEFVKSDFYKSINYDKKMGLIFDLPFFTLQEKAFLAQRANLDFEQKNPTTITFLNFLKDTIIEDDKRRSVVQHVMDALDSAENDFPLLKETFIADVREQNNNSIVHSKNIQGVSLLERIVDKLPLDDRPPLLVLNELTDEDLNGLLDELKPLWINEKYREACKNEELKYDISTNFDNVLSKLLVDDNGNKIDINDFVQKSFKVLLNQTDILTKNSEQIIDDIFSNRNLLTQHAEKNDAEYTAIMKQLGKMTNLLCEHSEESTKFYLQISKTLDELLVRCPKKKKEIEDTRRFLYRIRDGFFKTQNIVPGLVIISSILAGGFSPLLLILYGSTIVQNIGKEF